MPRTPAFSSWTDGNQSALRKIIRNIEVVPMATEERVFVAGAGPVGLVAAAHLIQSGIPVTVFEAGASVSQELRASTFHAPTMDMLDDLGFAKDLMAQGLIAPNTQYRSREGIIAQFDFACIADITRHPFRLQTEQFKLTKIIHAQLREHPLCEIAFNKRVVGIMQDDTSITVRFDDGAERRSRWLVGADGARSGVRHALGIEFDGFTWPERFLVVSTPYDFTRDFPDLSSVSYVADPSRWHLLLKVPGFWRVVFPVDPKIEDETATSSDYAQATLRSIVPNVLEFEIGHVAVYRVHQRVARTFRSHRVLLAGDAAHINNPLGGMGMNGGIHDAVNLAGRLAAIWRGGAPASELDRYDRQRRGVTIEYVEKATVENKRNLEARNVNDRTQFRDNMRRIAADPMEARSHVMKLSMIVSLDRASQIE
jgi:3-(3-hydroxy-phenyl)propionate hydroxylase